MHYLHMGPWPGFIGLCFDEKVFRRELKRMNVRDRGKVNFLGSERAHASLHHFVSSKNESTYILALGPTKGRSKEQIAGLVAHEAMHVVQGMQRDIANGESLGNEAEAYLIQMIVQEALQHLWKSSKVRRTEPVA